MTKVARLWLSRASLGLVLVGLAAMVVGYFAGFDGFGVCLAAAGLFAAVMGFWLSEVFSRPGEDEADAQIRESRRDAEQRKWAYTVLVMPICSLGVNMLSSNALREWGNDAQATVTSAMLLGPLMTGLGFVFLTSGLRNKHAQKWLNDELMLAYWASAMAWGFVAAFVALCVVFGVMLWRMQLALPMMPFVLWGTLLVAALRLWWQVRRADG
ncbi:hypothetical protein [uncultured Brevundimonas sp.]|uniref:hypothetical protein n=1 Tax=uncultured Brevundimonas sp. TaxID=213418 RepID=UPI002601F1AF|nr:hypothetical protein [uncultured Brevundimonas sp.]